MKLFSKLLAGAAMAVSVAAGAESCVAQSAQGSTTPPKPSAGQTAPSVGANGATNVGAASAGVSGASATAALPAGVLSVGEYSVPKPDDNGKTALVPFDSWKITAGANGGYALEATVITQATSMIEQRMTFDRAMNATSFGIVMGSTVAGQKRIGVQCSFDADKISCNTSAVDTTAKPWNASLAVKQPYAFMFVPESAAFDIPWIFQTVGWRAARVAGQKTPVAVVVIEQASSAAQPSLVVEETEQVEYLGRELVTVAGQVLNAHKFEIADQSPNPDGPMILWFSDTGLLLQMGNKSGPVMVLTKYQGPPLAN
jgi:hypothetical protein